MQSEIRLDHSVPMGPNGRRGIPDDVSDSVLRDWIPSLLASQVDASRYESGRLNPRQEAHVLTGFGKFKGPATSPLWQV